MQENDSDLVTFAEAARLSGIHRNTIKNWQKAGRLQTAQKVLSNGIETWLVSLAEIQELVRRSNSPLIGSQPNTTNIPPNMPPNDTQSPPSPEKGNNLSVIPNDFLKPLADVVERQNELIERQSEKIADLSLQVGELRGRLGAIEERQPVPATSEPPRQTAPNVWKIYFFVAVAAIVCAVIAVLILKYLIH